MDLPGGAWKAAGGAAGGGLMAERKQASDAEPVAAPKDASNGFMLAGLRMPAGGTAPGGSAWP